jgi:[ribosomal protein S5]-alanine N-acetyltransferase
MRIYLRELTKEDVDEKYLSWFSDANVTQFLSVDGSNLTKQTVVDYINHGIQTKTYFMYAICLKENDTHIGNLKIGPIHPIHGFSDLVAVIGNKEYWGKGLATEAITVGNELAFNTYNIRKLTGSIYSENIGSIKAYTRAGWVIEGILKSQFLDDKGKYQDEVFVSYFNPKFHQETIDYYKQREL